MAEQQERSVRASEAKNEVLLSSMSILSNSGAIPHVLLNTLTMGLGKMTAQAKEDGARLAYEPLRRFTWARLQMSLINLGIKRDTVLQDIGAVVEPARSEVGPSGVVEAIRKEPERKQYVLYYYLFEPLRFRFGKALESISKRVRKAQGEADVPVRVYSVSADEQKHVRNERSTDMYAVLTPYPEHMLLELYGESEDKRLEKKEQIQKARERRDQTSVQEQVRRCAEVIERGEFDGVSLNIVGLLQNVLFSNWKEAIPHLFHTTVRVKGKDIALVQMLELQTERGSDLGHDVQFEEALEILEAISQTGWRGPVLFAPGTNVDRKGKISRIKKLFGNQSVEEQ